MSVRDQRIKGWMGRGKEAGGERGGRKKFPRLDLDLDLVWLLERCDCFFFFFFF